LGVGQIPPIIDLNMFPQIVFLCGSVVWKDSILDVLDGENVSKNEQVLNEQVLKIVTSVLDIFLISPNCMRTLPCVYQSICKLNG